MDAPSSTESSLFEGFRLDRRAGVLLRRDERGVFAPMAIGSRALDILGVLVERPGIWSREPRSSRPSGRERRSKIATSMCRSRHCAASSMTGERRGAAYRRSQGAATALSHW